MGADRDRTPSPTLPTVEGVGPAKADDLYGAELASGARAGDYVIEGTVAKGGCGTVYTATHRVLGRRVALKVMHRQFMESPAMIKRFVREAQLVNRIRHPNIVDIHDFGQLADQRPFFVMELLSGRSLQQVLRDHGSLSPAETLQVMAPVCSALAAAHDAGVVHRDIKPSNIMLIGELSAPEKLQVKVLDFGIAKATEPGGDDSSLTMTGVRLGTPECMAPEQILGGLVDARTDVYALGVLMYLMMTGRLPFASRDPREMERLHLESRPDPPRSVTPLPAAIDTLIMRCLEKERIDRPESAQAVLEALRAAVEAAERGDSGEINASVAAAAAAGTATAIAVAVYVAARARAEDDDEAVDRATDITADAEARLRAAGHQIAIVTATSVLAISPAEGTRERALAFARSLHDALAAEAGIRVHVSVCCHAGAVSRGAGPEARPAGPLVELGAWLPARLPPGFWSTAAAAEGLDGHGAKILAERR